VWLSCSDPREMRRSMVEEIFKNRRRILDIRLTIPFAASYLGTGAALASLYPCKLANGVLVRIASKLSGLMQSR